jgi:hypothetical protein
MVMVGGGGSGLIGGGAPHGRGYGGAPARPAGSQQWLGHSAHG